MADIRIPYGKTYLTASVPDARLAGVLESKAGRYKPEAGEAELVRRALDAPVGSPRLRDLVRGKRRIVVLCSDHTRPAPSRIMTPPLLEEIRSGNPDAQITLLIATGFHRPSTREELVYKFGEAIVEREKIVIHSAFDASSVVNIGKLPSGGDLALNKLAVQADLLVAEGFIEPHFFAGFSGGRKSVMPGVASEATVLYNHNAGFIADENARTGCLAGNPLHIDMQYAAKAAGLKFILNVAINVEKKIIRAFAGDPEAAHAQGTAFVGDLAAVAAKPADIVITSNGGYPLDQNIYQSVKGMTAAEAACNDGGVIIICAACNDGHGGAAFLRWFQEAAADPRAVMDKIRQIPPEKTLADQWEAQILARVLLKHTVILVTDQCDHALVAAFGLRPAGGLADAMRLAEEIAGPAALYTVIPDGVSVIVR